jgi:hypothetical protein
MHASHSNKIIYIHDKCGVRLCAVWGILLNAVCAVCAVVCGSERGSVRGCAAVQQCATVRQCTAVRTDVCGSARGCVGQCTCPCAAVREVVCGSVCSSVRLSGSVRQCEAVCDSVRQCGSVQLSGSTAVCGRAAVCIFSNKFKIYSYKFGII